MYRKIMDYLKKWKSSEHRKPLILQGARQVGKTYSILEFGRTCYENVAYFNFETNPKLNETFACSGISHYCGRKSARCGSQQDQVFFSGRQGRYENVVSYGYGRIYACHG